MLQEDQRFIVFSLQYLSFFAFSTNVLILPERHSDNIIFSSVITGKTWIFTVQHVVCSYQKSYDDTTQNEIKFLLISHQRISSTKLFSPEKKIMETLSTFKCIIYV